MRYSVMMLAAEALLTPVLTAHGTVDTLHTALEAEYERALESASEQFDVTPLLDLLDGMTNEPLDLNRASESELEQIPGMSPLMAHRIVEQRNKAPFRNVGDLATVEGITPEVIGMLDSFVTVRKRSELLQTISHHVRIRTRAGRSAIGPSSSSDRLYVGTPEKLYTRLVASVQAPPDDDVNRPGEMIPSIALGLVTEKDPGERDVLDFLSGSLSATIPAVCARVVLGDFQVSEGQGLVFGGSSRFSKGGEATSGIARNGAGVRPSFSTNQPSFFRGGALQIDLTGSTFSLFYSTKRLDAITDSSGMVTQIDTDDLHRTEAELRVADRLREVSYGARFSCNPVEGLTGGISGIVSRFDKPVMLPGVFEFKGNRSTAVGMDASYVQNSWCAFAELALDGENRRAAAFGLLTNPGSGMNLAFLARLYPGDFQSLHGAGFSENGKNDENESGYYFGATMNPARWLSVNAYYDQFVFPWRTSATSFPSSGHEFLVCAEANPVGKVNVELRLRHKSKPVSQSFISHQGLQQRSDDYRAQQNVRATLTAGSASSILWRSRIEIVSVRYPFRAGTESGLLAYQDFSFALLRRVSLAIRAVAFQTDSFDSRLYEYETDVPGTCQNPALYGKGFRWFVVGRFNPAQSVSLSVKYSQTVHDIGRASLFMGATVLNGTDDRLSIQCDVNL